MKKVFISYRETDRQAKDSFVATLKNPNLEFPAIPEYSEEDMRAKGEKAVKDYILSIMRSCNVVIFLIGDNNHNSKWIQYEADVALSQQKRIILVRLPGTSGAPPEKLRNYRIYDMNYKELKNLI